MYRIIALFLSITAVSFVYGQTDSLSREDKRLLDSMFNNDEFIKLMMEKEKSFVDISAGIGNRIFSLKNYSLSAGQALTNKLFYTPSVGYFHKSGFALSLTGFVTSDEGSLKMYQYAITPSYGYSNKKFDAVVSYTRYIEGASTGFSVNPFKNDLYANAVYKKTWIEPGLAAGFSFGKQTEYYDTAFWLLNRVVHIRDTITTRLSGLTLTLSASHKWKFWELISKKDGLKLQPTLMLNGGSQKVTTVHSNRLINRFPRVSNYFKRIDCDSCASQRFTIQSLAFLAQLTYYYGKFYLQPQFYLDYYLPATDEKRLTTLFSITAGVSLY